MDIKIEKKPWYIRHRYYLLGGTAFVIFLIYVISLSFGPRKLRIETDNIQIAEVKNDKFMEYVDVEGLVQPILTIKINTREAGSVERIIGEEGTMMEKGDSIPICCALSRTNAMNGRNSESLIKRRKLRWSKKASR
jgi:multidrug efflux pump subunit AcrA (membrane-fusion protein)